MPNVTVTLLNIGGACHVLNAAKSGSCPLLKCRAVMLPIQDSARLGGSKVNFAPGKIPLWGNSRQKCINSLPAQETAKHCAKFGWLPLSNITAVTKPRRESRWNLLGCPKPPNWSHASAPKFTILWGRVEEISLLNSFFSDCRYVP